jgi:hypothetical protein
LVRLLLAGARDVWTLRVTRKSRNTGPGSFDPGTARIVGVIVSLLLVAALAAAPGKRKFTGTITDGMCAQADHSRMRMGPTDAECTTACVSEHGAVYGLYDGKAFYTLSDQRTPETLAGKKVTVTGTLDAAARTIQVDSMTVAR